MIRLSPQESRVLDCRRRGLSYKEVAQEMKLSFHTVKTHMRKVLEKLSARSTSEAIYIREQDEPVRFDVPIRVIRRKSDR